MTAIMDHRELKRGGADGRRLGGRITAGLRAFRDDVRGALAIVMGFFMVLLMGMAVLALDVGRMMVVEVQMQNAADAAALAAATQLTGASGARTLAEAVARNAASQTSLYPLGAPVILTIDTVEFFRNWTPGNPGTGDPATDDQNANVVRVTLNAQTLELMLQPVVNMLAGIANTDASTQTIHTAYAVAQQSTVSCETLPLMMCNPYEDFGTPCTFIGGQNFYDMNQIGRMMIIKAGPSNNPAAPGEFGMLELPDGTSGAKALGEAIAADSQDGCFSDTVTTAPGSKTQQILWGIKTRFGASPPQGFTNNPAPHVGPFPRDSDAAVLNVYMGNGDWNTTGPSRQKSVENDVQDTMPGTLHPFTDGTTTTATVPVDYPTRYQIYLWQTGVEFQVNGPVTAYPVVDTADLPTVPANVAGAAGWVTVNGIGGPTELASVISGPDTILTLPNADFQEERSAETAAASATEVTWVKRRNLKSAVLDCACLGVAGSGTFNHFGHIVESFVTEEPQSPGGPNDDVQVWAEYIGAPLAGTGSIQDIVRNIKLVE